ncbi:MAG TPA: hypothetical protein IAB55_11525 [Candidatus Merdivicinus faecavium]|nr:hypothetical protein [Candidatus Merdivicinus faecavium]
MLLHMAAEIAERISRASLPPCFQFKGHNPVSHLFLCAKLPYAAGCCEAGNRHAGKKIGISPKQVSLIVLKIIFSAEKNGYDWEFVHILSEIFALLPCFFAVRVLVIDTITVYHKYLFL